MNAKGDVVGTYDAAIIGGGVMGCATALHLARGGMRVVLVERGGLCAEASGRNAGTMTPMFPAPFLVPYALRGMDMWKSASRWLGRDVVVCLHWKTQSSSPFTPSTSAPRSPGPPTIRTSTNPLCNISLATSRSNACHGPRRSRGRSMKPSLIGHRSYASS